MKPMKTFFKLLISVGLIVIFSHASCDKWVCGDWWFINLTEHKISVDVYCFGSISTELSFSLMPNDSLKQITCDIGSSPPPFVSSTCRIDSILLVFDDTLVLNTLNYWEFNPENIEKWENYNRKSNKKYNFTESHYQKALEVNGYSR